MWLLLQSHLAKQTLEYSPNDRQYDKVIMAMELMDTLELLLCQLSFCKDKTKILPERSRIIVVLSLFPLPLILYFFN